MTSPSDPSSPTDPSSPDDAAVDVDVEAETAAAADDSPDGTSAGPRRPSRRVLLIAGAVVVALLVGVLVTLQLTRGGDRDPMSVVTITEEVGPPTPVTEPIARDRSTALLDALPDVVLGYAVSAQETSPLMLDQHAVEGWSLTYSDPQQAVVVQVGQWPTDVEAQAAFDAIRDAAGVEPAAAPVDVSVGDQVVGTMVLQQLDDETERTLWRNGTAVLVAEGPPGTTQPVYDAYGF